MNGDKLVRIQSKDKSTGTTSDFYCTVRDMQGVWRLESCLLPNCSYHIRTGINSTINFTANSVDYTAEISEGWYTSASLATEASSVMSTAYTPGTMTVTYNSTTGKMSTTNDQTHSMSVTCPALGYTTASASGVTTPGDSVVVLSSTDAYHAHIEGAHGQNRTGSSFMINNNANSGEFIYHRDRDTYTQLIRFPHSTTNMRVHLRDDEGRAISINGAHWSFVLSKI